MTVDDIVFDERDRRAYVKPAVGKSLPPPIPEPPNRCTRIYCWAWLAVIYGMRVPLGKTWNPWCKLLGHRWRR